MPQHAVFWRLQHHMRQLLGLPFQRIQRNVYAGADGCAYQCARLIEYSKGGRRSKIYHHTGKQRVRKRPSRVGHQVATQLSRLFGLDVYPRPYTGRKAQHLLDAQKRQRLYHCRRHRRHH